MPAARRPALPRGLGFGPAEISLAPVRCTGHTTTQQLLTGNGSYEGRYGATGVPAAPARFGPVDGRTSGSSMGRTTGSLMDYRPTGFSNVNDAGSYGSPPDPFGVGAVGLDQAGRPVYAGMNQAATSHYFGFGSGIANSPYELNLGPNVARGLPSTTHRPEQSVQPRRVGADLAALRPRRDEPARPAGGADPGLLPSPTDPANRLNVTTESWDVPVPETFSAVES